MAEYDSITVSVPDNTVAVKITGEPNTVEFDLVDGTVTLPYDPATVITVITE